MNKSLRLGCLIPAVAVFVGCPLAASGQALKPSLPFPESAKTFLDPVEMIVNSAPASAREKLKDDPKAPGAANELNRYFAQNILGKSIVLHAKVEISEPSGGVGWRIRAASIPVAWDGGTMNRESWLYVQPADVPEAKGVAIGSEIIVVGWVRKCQVEMTPQGLCIYFDLQYSKVLKLKNFPTSEAITPHANDAPKALIGTWRFTYNGKWSGARTFSKDGTFTGQGFGGVATWAIDGDKVVLRYPTVDHTYEEMPLPLRPAGMNITHQGSIVTAVKE